MHWKKLYRLCDYMRLIWNIDWGNYGATFNGRFYRLDGAQTGPRPSHPIRISLGAYGPKILRLTGRLGDGWTPSYGYAPPTQIPKMQQTIDQSLTDRGRKSNEVRRNHNLACIVLESSTKKASQQGSRMNSEQDGLLVGSVDFWIDTIVKFYKDLQMDSFPFWPANESSEQVELFAKKIVPKVKEDVKRERNT